MSSHSYNELGSLSPSQIAVRAGQLGSPVAQCVRQPDTPSRPNNQQLES